MRFCPNCGKPLMNSNFTGIGACSFCNHVFYIKRIVFEPPPQPKQQPTPPQKPKQEPYKPKDLTSIPDPVKPAKDAVDELKENKEDV